MNAKQMEEALVQLQAAVKDLTDKFLVHVDSQHGGLVSQHQITRAKVGELFDRMTASDEKVSEMRDHQDGQNDVLHGLVQRVEDLAVKVEGRNSSAPVKRNMTDKDALDILTGEHKDMSHKDAAEAVGLTYAQVYSCRLEYTFKHIHKELRDAKWKNPWSK